MADNALDSPGLAITSRLDKEGPSVDYPPFDERSLL